MDTDNDVANLLEEYRRFVDGEGGLSIDEVIELAEGEDQKNELIDLIKCLTSLDRLCEIARIEESR